MISENLQVAASVIIFGGGIAYGETLQLMGTFLTFAYWKLGIGTNIDFEMGWLSFTTSC